MELKRLRTLHMENPMGIDVNPYFSWMFESKRQNVIQKAYRLYVKDSQENYVWDSGWNESDENTFIPYEGEKLRSREKYHWTVEVRNNYEETADSTAYFETAFLDRNEWKAVWAESALLVTERKDGFGNQPPATMFRRSFSLEAKGKVASARLYVTSRGVYRLYLNGERVDEREFAPGYSSYDKQLSYQTYDMAEYLKDGENVLGLYVGDGWYFSPETTIHKAETVAGHHAVLFEMRIQYEDGTEEIVTSDEHLRTAYGPVLFSDIFAGERYDSGKELEGWNAPGYDDSGWKEAKCCSYPMENLAAEPGDRIIAVKEISPKSIFKAPNGDCIVDFGQNMAGRVRVHTVLPAGYKVVLEHFEVLDKEGNYFNTIFMTNGVGAGADQKVEYISSGKEAIYEPYFTFLGFRYVRVRFYDANGQEQKDAEFSEVKAGDFTAVALSTEKANLGNFSCSDSKLNQLYSNIRWSQYSNMISIPTDCPQREKAGWTGDAGIYAETALLNEDVTAFFTRWLKSMEADQQGNGVVPMVVPFNETYRIMSEMMGQMSNCSGPITSAGWGDAAVKVPWSMYKVTGNRAILKDRYDMMKKWCDYIIRTAEECGRPELPREKEKYLWDTGFHYGEWVIPSTSLKGFEDQEAVGMAMVLTARYTAPIYGYYSVSTFAEIAKILGCEEDHQHYSDIALKMKDAIQSCLIGPNGEAPAEYMGAYVLLLYFDLMPEKYREQYAEHLAEMIKNNGGCLDTGFLATPYLLDTLVMTGHTDIAYDLLFQTKIPSWLYEVENGATTIWETWNAVDGEGNPQHVSMNHYSFGCVADWMFRTIGGIRADRPGFKHMVIEPKPDHRIEWARREYLTEQGTVSCSWEKTAEGLQVKITVPCNTRATVVLPNGTKQEVGSGNYSYSC